AADLPDEVLLRLGHVLDDEHDPARRRIRGDRAAGDARGPKRGRGALANLPHAFPRRGRRELLGAEFEDEARAPLPMPTPRPFSEGRLPPRPPTRHGRGRGAAASPSPPGGRGTARHTGGPAPDTAPSAMPAPRPPPRPARRAG